MGQPFVGEIRMFGGNFAPVGWQFCDGQTYPISQNETLFQLLGTRYGGDGETNFAVPNLSSRAPVHMTTVQTMGEMGGVESMTLTTNQLPVHNHALLASEGTADSVAVSGNVPAEATKRFYLSPGTTTTMSPQAIGPTGGSQPHENMQPFTVVTFIISFFGVYPQPT